MFLERFGIGVAPVGAHQAVDHQLQRRGGLVPVHRRHDQAGDRGVGAERRRPTGDACVARPAVSTLTAKWIEFLN